jgi:hypothetical protein
MLVYEPVQSRVVRSVYVSGNRVTPASTPLREQSYEDVLKTFLGSDGPPLEAYSRDTRMLVAPEDASASRNRFIAAVHAAYANHYPLVLSPDIIWLLIAQGFAIHVGQNAKSLRDRFVGHQGKENLIVIPQDFLRGFAGNDWEGIFTEFSEQIRLHIGDTAYQNLVPHFSTTGIVEKAAFEIALMDAMQSYFRYFVGIVCGIPWFLLEGTTEDWKKLRNYTAALQQYGLDWWIPYLLPVLDEFIAASEGEPDPTFWENFYRVTQPEGCGFDGVNGYVLQFFPYLPTNEETEESKIKAENYLYSKRENAQIELASIEDPDVYEARLAELRRDIDQVPTSAYERNPLLAGSKFRRNLKHGGIPLNAFSSGLSSAPFTLIGEDDSISSMEFVAGFVGVAQDTPANTLMLRPQIGWAIRKKK